jgi:hypothetical protein
LYFKADFQLDFSGFLQKSSQQSKKDLPFPCHQASMRYLILLALCALLLCSPGAFGQMNSITNNTKSEDINASTSMESIASSSNEAAAKEPTASELAAMVVNSTADLQSYRFSLDMEQSMDLVNLSSGEEQKLATVSLGFGSINMTARALKLAMASLTIPEGDDENTTAMSMEEYLLNDTIYLKAEGNWTAMELPGISEAWSQQSTMNQQIEMLSGSNLSLLGSEMVEGEDCYKLLAEIDMASFANQLSEQTDSYLSLIPMNFSELFNNMTLDAYYWIAKDTKLLKKAVIVEEFTVSPQLLGLPAKGPESQEMSVNNTISVLYMDFNESINIKVPAEALNATVMPLPMAAVASNATDLNATAPNATASSA